MPTTQVTVCTSCWSQACDGALWVWAAVTRKDGREVDLATIPAENRGPSCSSSFGRKHKKALVGAAVGAEVTLFFPNWVEPSYLTLRKVEA